MVVATRRKTKDIIPQQKILLYCAGIAEYSSMFVQHPQQYERNYYKATKQCYV